MDVVLKNVPLSTLFYANANRTWQIYQDLAMVLIAHRQKLYGKDEFSKSIKALDFSTIDLRLSLFPWAEFREYKGSVEIRALMNLQEAIPAFIHILRTALKRVLL